MTHQVLSERARASVLPAVAAALAGGIFAADVLTPPDCVVGGLYVIVVLIASRFCGARGLWLVAAACAGLTVWAQFLAHRLAVGNDQAAYIGAFNTAVSILAIMLSTYLILRGQSAEAALQRAQTDLARASRVTIMGELTASIAHEVNQPIAAAVANASACLRWLAGETPDLGEARAAATRIVRDGTRAAEIIGRIRAIFAKGDAERRAVDLNQLVRETLELLGVEATRHAVVARLDLERGLPPVQADRVQLQQVLVNLVLNAFDAMKDVEGPRELTVRSRQDRDRVELSVADTGEGLPAAQAAHIFDAFVTTKAQGTGLGLSISRSIVEAHHGQLRAGPNGARGAVFAFTLPIDGEAAPDPQ